MKLLAGVAICVMTLALLVPIFYLFFSIVTGEGLNQ